MHYFAPQDVFFMTNLRDHTPFSSSISCINSLFCFSKWLLCLIFASRLTFINLILRVKTSFCWQLCASTSPFTRYFARQHVFFLDKSARPPAFLHVTLLVKTSFLLTTLHVHLPFLHVILHVKMSFPWQLCAFTDPFSPLISCFNLLFCVSGWLLFLILLHIALPFAYFITPC